MANINISGLPTNPSIAGTDILHTSQGGIDYKATVEELGKNLLPIGYIYTQYPNKDSPSDLGLIGTWTNISSTFAGDFFRAEGGNATTFESGEQLDKFQGFGIIVKMKDDQGTISDFPAQGGSGSTVTPTLNAGVIAESSYGTPRTGIETNPVNHTIRIWERTA